MEGIIPVLARSLEISLASMMLHRFITLSPEDAVRKHMFSFPLSMHLLSFPQAMLCNFDFAKQRYTMALNVIAQKFE